MLQQNYVKSQRENTSAVDVAQVLSELEKKENNFISSQAMVVLGKLKEAVEANPQKFFLKNKFFLR